MSYNLIFAVIFYVLLICFFYKHKKNVQVHGIFALYRTKLGLKWMEKTAFLFRKILRAIAYLSIAVGFGGMIFIFYFLIKSSIGLLNGGASMLAPVLPGVKISGLPSLGFWHWIIAIFFVAVVHEFAHGVFSRVYGIKVKSSGFALFGPILAAFVEPDEKTLAKKKKRQKLAVFSAGPFTNIVFGILFLFLLNLAMSPIYAGFYEADGVKVNNFVEGYPAEISGLKIPFVIHSINGKEIKKVDDFLKATEDIKPGSAVELGTNQGEFNIGAVENPEAPEKGFIGIQDFSLEQKIIEGKSKFLAKTAGWFFMLVFWLFVVNVGVGLFNLLPLGPVDGGRMFRIFSGVIFRDKKKAQKLFVYVSLFCLFLILFNLMPYILKLLFYIAKPFLWLIGLI